MADFKAPLRDMRFSLKEVLNYGTHCSELTGYEEVGDDLLDAILEEAAKFVEQELAPINQSGDQQGCQWNDSVVTTPCLLYTAPSPRDGLLSRMPSSA